MKRKSFFSELQQIFRAEYSFPPAKIRYPLFQTANRLKVAKKLGISRSYISRIEKRAIEKARENLSRDDFFTE